VAEEAGVLGEGTAATALGEEAGATTGLMLLGHRYYDPSTSRFLTRDPISYDGGLNLYTYCGNNPLGRMDPSGSEFAETSQARVEALELAAQDGPAPSVDDGTNDEYLGPEPPGSDTFGDTLGAMGAAAFCATVMSDSGAEDEASVLSRPRMLAPEDEIGSYIHSKAPDQIAPGSARVLEGQHVDDLGRVQPWRAHYDEFGRQIGRTDYNAENKAKGYPATHYHTYGRVGAKRSGRRVDILSHEPGEFVP